MAKSTKRTRRLGDTYAFEGLRPSPIVRGVFGDPKARVISLVRRSKKRCVAAAGKCIEFGTTAESARFEICHAAIRGCTWSSRYAPGALSKLWQSEARATGVFGGQSVLHQTLCLLCRAAVSDGNGPGHRQGTQTGLAHGERARQAVHEGAAG